MSLKEQLQLTLATAVNLALTLAPSLQMNPHIVAAISLAKHLVEDHWDEIWAIAESDPVVFDTLFKGLV